MSCPIVLRTLSACGPFLLPILLLTFRLAPAPAQDSPATHSFDTQIAPLLAAHCLGCHGTDDPKGGLNLTTLAGFRKGGDSGSPYNADQPDDSLLLQRVLQGEMPPEKPLPAQQQQILQRWIQAGATWGTDPIDPYQYSSETRAGFDWWSLRPLQNISAENPAAIHPIDAFVDAKLRENGLQRSPQADRRTLIRRLSFDLLGLPPEPADVAAFLADNSPHAWEQLVDRMLASPHYGERWARHWLDVVRFGESNGFEYDEPRDNAWPYRNWLIDAFNNDLPYDQFVRLQIAGDVMQPQDALAAAASGFLVAGAHNTTLPSSEKMRQSMAQDEMEDLVGTVGQTFLGLTVNCARCHDHKFDPISAREYYSFAAALAGVRHGTRDVKIPLNSAQQQQLQQAKQTLQITAQQLDQLTAPVISAILKKRQQGQPPGSQPPQPMAAWEFNADLQDSIGELHGTARGNAAIKDGSLQLDGAGSFVETPPLPKDIREKTLEAWVRLGTLEQSGGAAVSLQTTDGSIFDAIVFAEREPRRWMAGSNGFTRTSPFNGTAENDAADRFVHVAIVYQQDGTIIGYREGLPYGSAFRRGDLQIYAAKTAQLVFGLRHGPAGGNRLLQGSIDRVQFYDRALTADEVAASAFARGSQSIPRAELLAAMTEDQKHQLLNLEQQQKSASSLRRSLQEQQQSSLYTCISAEPGITHVLKRGDVSQPSEVVAPAGLRAVRGAAPDFQLPPNSSDRERRMALATWITHPENPLFARVMTNRVWHYHFGQGIVPTPGDFGFNGGRPSHPELLDWLASEFRRQGFLLKPLHRLIVTSETWKQASLPRPDAKSIDADNRLLYRRTPQRLEAESLRDAMLAAAGVLDRTVGGRGYRDMRHFKFKGSNFYDPLTEDGNAGWRRTIYRFVPRGGRNPFLDTFDCPDPSAAAQRRPVTTTPLQALALLNNDLVFRLAESLTERARREIRDDQPAQISWIFETALGRTADPRELQQAADFSREFGLSAWCRVLLNSNEFVYVR
jgi:cytochrome c553